MISSFAYSNIETPTTVNLPAPITVTGSAQALSLNLQVSQSAIFPSECDHQGIVQFSIAPTFNLTTADPSNAVVYVNCQTRRQNMVNLAVGSVARFNGLLFNDNGMLGMDCLEVGDGVAVEPAPASTANIQSRETEQGTFSTEITLDLVSGIVHVVHSRTGKTVQH